jgi:hypothetical protein
MFPPHRVYSQLQVVLIPPHRDYTQPQVAEIPPHREMLQPQVVIIPSHRDITQPQVVFIQVFTMDFITTSETLLALLTRTMELFLTETETTLREELGREHIGQSLQHPQIRDVIRL